MFSDNSINSKYQVLFDDLLSLENYKTYLRLIFRVSNRKDKNIVQTKNILAYVYEGGMLTVPSASGLRNFDPKVLMPKIHHIQQ